MSKVKIVFKSSSKAKVKITWSKYLVPQKALATKNTKKKKRKQIKGANKHQYRQHSKECMWRQLGHFHMVFNVYDSKVTRGKGVMSPYIEYESPVSYGRKVMCRVKFLSNVGQKSWSRSCNQNL